jgi:hypothetical protein
MRKGLTAYKVHKTTSKLQLIFMYNYTERKVLYSLNTALIRAEYLPPPHGQQSGFLSNVTATAV